MQIYLVVWDREAFQLSEKLFFSVASYIDAHYVAAKETEEYGEVFDRVYRPSQRFRRDWEPEERFAVESSAAEDCASCYSVPMTAPKPISLEDMLKNADAGFSETLLRLIDKTGKKDSEIYKKANLSKQHFSKIRNNPNYKPTKPTAIALALALELDLEQTKDLIGRAGYALTNSSKFDLIVRYFIEQGNYNVMEINMTLYEFDQSLLGV